MKRFIKNFSIFISWLLFVSILSAATRYKIAPKNVIIEWLQVTSWWLTTGSVYACLNCSWVNSIPALTDWAWNYYISTWVWMPWSAVVIQWIYVSTWVAWWSSDTLLMSQKAISWFVNTKIASYLLLANSWIYFNTNSWVYFETNSGKYFNTNSGIYFNLYSGTYFNLYSWTYFNANSWTYYTSNPLWYITWSSLSPYALLSWNQTLTGTFKLTNWINIWNNTDTCTWDIAWTIKYSWDNFYWCKLSSWYVLLN